MVGESGADRHVKGSAVEGAGARLKCLGVTFGATDATGINELRAVGSLTR
jgi:hypothetical protein